MNACLSFAIVSLAALALSTGAALAFSHYRVDQTGLHFSVATIQVHRGDVIVFANGDRSSHNITIRGGAMNFNGGLQRPGQNVEVPFTAAGTYEVMCGIHPRMHMTVEVQ